MPQLVLDLANDMTCNTNGDVTIQLSSQEGNLFQIKEDGLYAKTAYDWNIRDGQKTEGITVGIASDYYPLTTNASGRIALTGLVHRTFLSTGENVGEKLVGLNGSDEFRSQLDYCLPGDIFRVKNDDDTYDYYLIIKTDPLKDDNGYAYGNIVTDYAKLGTWGAFNVTPPTPGEDEYNGGA